MTQMDERKFQQELRKKERHLIAPRQGGDVRVALAYPNRYWIAMSNLGFQTVYRLLNDEPRFLLDRAYIPENEGVQIRLFDSGGPLSSVDIVALSVSFETDYPYVLEMIAQAGVDLEGCLEKPESRPARDSGPFVLGGGAALTLNPEPVANFFDAIVIGESEEVLSQITREYLTWHDSKRGRAELLNRLAQIEGVYVPSLYRPSYSADGRLEGITPSSTALPERVIRRYVEDLDRYPTRTVIQTPETEFKSMFMTETGRGCEVGCRFCVAGYMYRPVRKRGTEAVVETVRAGVETSDSIGFVGAAVSSHPAIAELAGQVAAQGKRAALSSIMSQRVTQELAASLSESEYKTVALAPEAGSEQLRFRVGKRVCDEQIELAVSTLARNGIRNFKLYFIVGLPGETEDDLSAIAALTRRLHDSALQGAREQSEFRIAPKLILSVNPFIPKAWTPFQRHGFLPFKEIKRRLGLVRRAVMKIPNVEMKAESPRESYFQTVMSRGDRRVGDLLVELRRRGLDWRGLVKEGAGSVGPGLMPPDYYVYRTFSAEEFLPWEVVDLRIKRSLLEREYERALNEDVAPLIVRAKKMLKQGAGPVSEGGSV